MTSAVAGETRMLAGLWAVALWEWRRTFATPLAAVVICAFLVLAGGLTFTLGGFFGRNQADLVSFFSFHPWLYQMLAPALAMRLWADERRAGTIELITVQPVSLTVLVLGKFLAAWAVLLLALALTFPVVVIVETLGEPDPGMLASGYFGSALLAGAFVAIGGFASSLSKSQVVAFVAGAGICFALTIAGESLLLDPLRGLASDTAVRLIGYLSVLPHYGAMVRGVIGLRDVLYFLSLIGLFLFATQAMVQWLKAR